MESATSSALREGLPTRQSIAKEDSESTRTSFLMQRLQAELSLVEMGTDTTEKQ